MKNLINTVLLLTLIASSFNAQAVLNVRVTKSANDAQPIAIVPFGWSVEGEAAPADISSIVSADLERSGQFKALANADMLTKPISGQKINFANWRSVNVDHLVVGNLRKVAAEMYAIDVQLFDVLSGKQLLGHSYPVHKKALRKTAHHISDVIYEKLTGVRGAFNTRIAYVSVNRSKTGQKIKASYSLQVADADGYNPRTVVKSSWPLLSPSWSPDGVYLAYVSFRNRQAEVYTVNLKTGAEQKLAAFKGINGAPVFSPDGNKLAFTSSKSGNPDIYVMDLRSRKQTQITRGYAIETEPAWSADGRDILFTSSRTGGPQIYSVSASGGKAKRVTFDGRYNASVAVAPNNQHLAMVHGAAGKYRIAVLDRESALLRVLSDGSQDESPSFAPNGRMILYATQAMGKGVLAAVSVDGRTKQQLLLTDGDIREPAWSPFNKQR